MIESAPMLPRVVFASCAVLIFLAWAMMMITEPKPPTLTLQSTAVRWLEFVAWAAIIGGVMHFLTYMVWSFAHWVRTGT